MSKVRHIAQGSPLPEWFLDDLQELVSTYASPNFQVTVLNPTTLQVVAGSNNDQACISISKSGTTVWRWNSTTVSGSAPGGLAAGDHDVFVTAYADAFTSNPTPPPNEIDTAALTFGLMLLPAGTTPSGAAGSSQEFFRKVASFTWSGTAITDVRQTVGGSALPKHEASHLAGGSDPLPWTTIHGRGTLAARPAYSTTVSGYTYFATDVNGGTLYRASDSLLAWEQTTVGLTAQPQAHAASHAPGGSDALPWASAHGYGTLAARPAAFSSNVGYIYYATDNTTLYRSNGSSWDSLTAAAPSSTSISSAIILKGALSARPAAAAGNTAFLYLAQDENGGTLYRSTGSAWDRVAASVTAGTLSVMQTLALLAVEGVTRMTAGDPATSLQVSASTGMNLSVAAGDALVQGDDATNQGIYGVETTTTTSLTLTSVPAVNNRVDAIVARYNDPAFTGRTPTGLVFEQVQGTETSGATISNLTGAPGQSGGPAFPPSALLLAYYELHPADSSTSSGRILEQRKAAGPAIWGEDSHRYRLGIDSAGNLGVEKVV